ncbi:MAG: ATP-binding protein [Rhodocyclaceae bacterium]|nr:ATP-binding protein [Rhodocyclaceae bacterium]
MVSDSPGQRKVVVLTTAIAALLAVVVALVPTVSYSWAAYASLRGAIEAEAQINSRLLSQIINQNPVHWRLQEARYQSLLTRRPKEKAAEVRRLVDAEGRTITESADAIGEFTTTIRMPVYDSGATVGYLEVSRSLQPIAQSAAWLAMLSFGLSLLAYFGLRSLPLRALKKALHEVVEAKDQAFKAEHERHKAEAVAHLRSMFLANMSHELRTPMNGVLGMLELTLDTTPLDDEQREYLQVAQQSANHLLSILNDILDFSKIDQGRLDITMTSFNLPELLASVLNTLRHGAQEKGLQLESVLSPGFPTMVYTDPGRLRQVMLNLVGNAIKFTRQGRICLKARVEEEGQGRFAHILVEDTGIGIPEDKLELVFKPFSQADGSITRKFGGTGLGLTIGRQLTELMGGQLWATSTEGEGSVFHVRLPINPPPALATP